MQLKHMTFNELYSHEDFDALAVRYTQESGVKDFGDCCPSVEIYLCFEQDKELKCVGVFDEEKLVGFALVTKLTHFHYSKTIACIDAIFIDRPYRRGGLGLKLIDACKGCAKEMGSSLLSASAPVGSRLAKLLSIIAKHTDNDYLFNLEQYR